MTKWCRGWWGSHACGLVEGHLGDCLCLNLLYSNDSDEPWVWFEEGGCCNFWDGKEIVFLNVVCSYGSSFGPGYPLFPDN